jgi:hypothetical protein
MPGGHLALKQIELCLQVRVFVLQVAPPVTFEAPFVGRSFTPRPFFRDVVFFLGGFVAIARSFPGSRRELRVK